MARLTKTQQKRLVDGVMSKATKLYMYSHSDMAGHPNHIIDTKDMIAIEKLCSKWFKRIG